MKVLKLLSLLLILGGFSACKSYTSNIILQAEDGDENWQSAYNQAVVEYPIKIGDKIQFTLFTNEGEAIIDPSGKLTDVNNNGTGDDKTQSPQPVYEVLESGSCVFPVIGKMDVLGLKTSQLDSVLSLKYEEYYNSVYVKSKVINKKLVVIGGAGGQIIPFTSGINLLEVIALYGGLDDKSKGYNIRIIRGDLKNPQVKVVNLRTIEDMKSSIVALQPDDIVYIEPVRRPASEGIRDNIYIMNILQVLVTVTLLFNTLTR